MAKKKSNMMESVVCQVLPTLEDKQETVMEENKIHPKINNDDNNLNKEDINR